MRCVLRFSGIVDLNFDNKFVFVTAVIDDAIVNGNIVLIIIGRRCQLYGVALLDIEHGSQRFVRENGFDLTDKPMYSQLLVPSD